MKFLTFNTPDDNRVYINSECVNLISISPDKVLGRSAIHTSSGIVIVKGTPEMAKKRLEAVSDEKPFITSHE